MMTMIKPATATVTENDMQAVKDTTSRPARGLPLRSNATASKAKIDETAKEFEAQFVAQMLSNMFSTVDPHESLGGSDAEEVYQSLLVNEYGKILARTGGVGVADQVKQMMIQQQEVE